MRNTTKPRLGECDACGGAHWSGECYTVPAVAAALAHLPEAIGVAVHDLTTGIQHKHDVLNGATDECLVLGRVIADRVMSPEARR